MVSLRSVFLIIIVVSSILGQEIKISVIQIEEAYNNINFERAITLSSQALEIYDLYSANELVEIYKLRGFAYFHIGKEKEARSSFLAALSINPNLELNEITVSPKIIDFFNNLKNNNVEPMVSEKTSLETRYILMEDPRPNSALRSIVLPGWGQYYKGEKNKAYIVFSAFAINSAALIFSLIKENSMHDDYLNSRETNDIQTKYNTYNTWFKTRQILTYSEVLIWSYAFTDALWFPTQKENFLSIQVSPKSLSINLLF